jgi:MFS superfamily sulfate permease-like transporter
MSASLSSHPIPLKPDNPLPIVVDQQRGWIRVAPRQFHSRAEFVEHFETLTRLVQEARRSGHGARFILDLRDAPVLSAETAEVVRSANMKLYRGSDRVAMVITSQLLRIQARRMYEHPNFETFEAIADAEALLLAETP